VSARRIVVALLAASVGTLLGSVGAVPAGMLATEPAAAAADCSAGVIVAVDLQQWQSTVDTVCLAFLPPNAADVLVDGGFSPTGVAEYGGLAFICQILGYPQGEDCQTTPPATAYWSFWYADAGQGGSWSYSELGAESLEPQAGSIEAWVFGGETAGSQPPIPPPDTIRADTTQVVTSTSTTTSTSPPSGGTTTGPGGSSSSSGGPAPSGTSGGSGSSGNSSTPAQSSSVAPSTSGSTGPSAGSGTAPPTTAGKSDGTGPRSPPATSRLPDSRPSAQPKVVSAIPVGAARPSAGSATSVVVGAVVVVLLAGLAGLVVRRRRRTGTS